MSITSYEQWACNPSSQPTIPGMDGFRSQHRLVQAHYWNVIDPRPHVLEVFASSYGGVSYLRLSHYNVPDSVKEWKFGIGMI